MAGIAGEENAAVELIDRGVNGAVARQPTPESLGEAIAGVVQSGQPLRESTLAWFADHAHTLRLERSLEVVLAGYARASR